MSSPLHPDFTPAAFSRQDFGDDDSAVLDSLVQETNAPADTKYAIDPVIEVPQFKPVAPTKLFTATVILAGGAQPFPLLPEDVNRVTCRVRAFSTNASLAAVTYNDFCLLHSEPGVVSSRMQNFLITLHHDDVLDIDGHTGAVWVIPGPGMSSSIEVTAWGVTSYDR